MDFVEDNKVISIAASRIKPKRLRGELERFRVEVAFGKIHVVGAIYHNYRGAS